MKNNTLHNLFVSWLKVSNQEVGFYHRLFHQAKQSSTQVMKLLLYRSISIGLQSWPMIIMGNGINKQVYSLYIHKEINKCLLIQWISLKLK